MDRWKWGNDPLPEQERYAEAVRDLTSMVLSLEQVVPALTDLLDALDVTRHELAALMPKSNRPRVGKYSDGPGRVYLDHCRDIGTFNPMFPTFAFTSVTAERATGTATFPVCYEAAAGLVNGGFLGVFFDAIISLHNTEMQNGGPTRNLELRFRRPVFLDVDLEFEIDRVVDETSVHSEARLLRRGEVLTVARSSAVRHDAPAVVEVSPRRTR